MLNRLNLTFILILASLLLIWVGNRTAKNSNPEIPQVEGVQTNYWLMLHRQSNREELLLGQPGDKKESHIVKTFKVKSGIPNQRPTPLPQLLGRDFWLIVDKFDSHDSTETAPYFLKLDIPYSDEFPYGPTPYSECNGQCNWVLPGAFGLHGVAGDDSRLSDQDPGSSGCIRHTDADITYLYNILDLSAGGVRYYIEDN